MSDKIKDFESRQKSIQSSIDKEHFTEAYDAVEELLLTTPFAAHLLVLRAQIIQLLQENVGPDLSDAKENLKAATRIDPRSAEAWIELGHFQLNVEDNPQQALKSFNRARTILRERTLELENAYSKLSTEAI